MADVAVADYPTFRRLYAASCCGGVWKSDDLGQTWKPVFEHAASSAIGDVTVAPSNPDIVWVGTGETNIFRSSYAGTGVYKSTDGAKTWQHMGLTDTQTIGRIVIHPTNPDIVYVAAGGHEWTDNEMRGVFKTTDGGKTWTKVLYVSPQTGANDLVMDPGDPNTLYAAMWQRERRKWADPRTEPGFTRAASARRPTRARRGRGSKTACRPARILGRIGLDVARSNPNVVYAFVDNYARGDKAPPDTRNPYGVLIDYYPIGNEVYRSDDKGATWTKTSGQDAAAEALHARPVVELRLGVRQHARRSERREHDLHARAPRERVARRRQDVRAASARRRPVRRRAAGTVPAVAGQTTTAGASQAGPGVARRRDGGPGGDNHAMWLDPNDPNFMLIGNDSGFRCRRDGGDLDAGGHSDEHVLRHGVRHGHAVPCLRICAGSRQLSRRVDLRNGVAAMKPIPFESAPGGEGSTHAIDPTNPNIVYSAGTYGAITRTDLTPAPDPAAAAGAGADAAAMPRTSGRKADAGRRRRAARPVARAVDPLAARPEHALLRPAVPLSLARSRRHVGEADARSQRRRQGATRRSAVSDGHLDLGIAEEGRLIYYGMDDGRLHVSIDAGKEWTDLTARLPKRRSGSRRCSPRNTRRARCISRSWAGMTTTSRCISTSPPTTARRGRALPAICRADRST